MFPDVSPVPHIDLCQTHKKGLQIFIERARLGRVELDHTDTTWPSLAWGV